MQREQHANCNQKGPVWDLNLEPSCCKEWLIARNATYVSPCPFCVSQLPGEVRRSCFSVETRTAQQAGGTPPLTVRAVTSPS
ncbi:hypothetical protein AMECASPLE_009482 [Ameca splendens]|uniref:Uncharacterized protein n=1 Tax=Ameca splendens TaxID=208324 RepID=A0ABV0ZWH7_9TELE